MISITDIRKKYTPEMALVILVCRVYLGKATGAELREYLSANKIDWSLFERIITVHQVRPLIYKALSANAALVAPEFLENLRRTCFHIATGNLQKLEELTRISRLLDDNGIINVPYKGVILSYFLFGDFISRETADIDVLIDAKDFSNTREILVNDGYESKYYNPDFAEQFLVTSHELQFKKSTASGIIKIEVHWAATNAMMNIPLPNSVILGNPSTMKLPGGTVSIFNLEHHLLVLLVHHGVNDVWRVLRHTLDITLFLDKYYAAIDWKVFHVITSKYKVRHTTEVGFLIAEQLFGVETPAPFISGSLLPGKILDNLLTFPAIRKSKLTAANLGQQLFLRDSLVDKVSVLLSYGRTGIQPNVRDMEAYPLKKHWYWLYYFIKPFRIIFGTNKTINETNK